MRAARARSAARRAAPTNASDLAARIAFGISPNSASCERVFALLEEMYGGEILADQLRAAIMLAYNKRTLG